jgi:hypothetical protein
MDVDQEIKLLELKRSEMIRDIEKKAGGNSTMAYRWLGKAYEPELKQYSEKIAALKKLKAKL